MTDIPFSRPTYLGTEPDCLREAIANAKLSGDGPFTDRATKRLAALTGQPRVLLTGSCSHALEMTALLLDLSEGDEVIMPSYTFVSTANAFALRGAVPVFVDVRPDTMNIDEKHIEAALSEKTRAIVVMHYGGVACEMDAIMSLAASYRLPVIEDAAQAVNAFYRGRHLGTIGSFGTFSFHDTKNITAGGEGGALLVNDPQYYERARIMREKGTNRSLFLEGMVDKYTWVDRGSSYLMSELNAAYLYPQLDRVNEITAARLDIYRLYRELLQPLRERGCIDTLTAPPHTQHNAHLFAVKAAGHQTRNALISWLRDRHISAPFHYIPLHTAPAGKQWGKFAGKDRWTTRESERLVRLPLYYGLTPGDARRVVHVMEDFFNAEKT